MKKSYQNENISYLPSFLQILVIRNGGELVIENLSEFSGMVMEMKMDLQASQDRVVLKARKEPMPAKRRHH